MISFHQMTSWLAVLERGDATWVSAVTDDVRFLKLDKEYIDSTLGAISRVKLVNAKGHPTTVFSQIL